ncbi:MAG: gluconate 2-dehydrogenase subunit 3 family protein [Acidobacteriota bacterium]|nr:gluconate 2-dehydrogenase subunit 3 family protein [Acidobacteriota bacterium]
MSNFNDVSRRDLFRIVGSTVVVAPAFAQHIHNTVAEVKSLSGGANYPPKLLTKHYFLTLRKLGDLIVPGSEDAGAAEYIDFLASRNEEIATIFNGGIGWIDEYMEKHYGSDFLSAKPQQQTALLDQLAYRKNLTPENAAGQRFFTWLRNMVVDAYYTSPAGVAAIGYMGNGAMAQFSVPQEAVDYVMKRSPI